MRVGATSLKFRGCRSGANRGGSPRLYPLDAEAIPNAHVIGAAPMLLAALRATRNVLAAVERHAPAYDWNADPLGLTLAIGSAYTIADAALASAVPIASPDSPAAENQG